MTVVAVILTNPFFLVPLWPDEQSGDCSNYFVYINIGQLLIGYANQMNITDINWLQFVPESGDVKARSTMIVDCAGIESPAALM